MTRYSYDIYGMAKDTTSGDADSYVLASGIDAEAEFFDVSVYQVDEDGEREFPDPVWEFEGLGADDVQVIVDLVRDKLQAEFGEWL